MNGNATTQARATFTRLGGAALHSAVSQNCILPRSERVRSLRTLERPAECNSAIRQSATLRYGNQRAFTLIELILAIGVMAIALAAVNAVFFSAMRLRQSTTDSVDAALPIERTLSTLRRDLQGAMPPSADGILSGDFRVGGVSSLGLSQPVDIELYTTTGAMHEDEPWGDVQKVTYELRMPENRFAAGKDLYRSVTRNLLATIIPQPDDQWMMGGVESIQFSCYDGTGWYDTWDSTVTTNLPTAVRVRILLAEKGNSTGTPRPIEMIVTVDSQTRTNQTISTDTTGG